MEIQAADIEKLQDVLTEALKEEWEAQGHNMTGKIINDIEYVVKQETNALVMSGMIYAYGSILAAGTKANRIPFSPGSGAKSSLYIKALQEYAKQRMNIQGEKESLSVAFAIAREQKKHGMPTPGSYSFSKTGERLKWIEEAFLKHEDKILEVIREMGLNFLTVRIDTLINKWKYEFDRQ